MVPAMSVTAPLRIPVELRAPSGDGPRWFRLAHGVSEMGLLFPRALPDELEGPVALAFHLPEDPAAIACRGRVIEIEGDERTDERPVRRGVRFVGLAEETRARIARYVEERMPQ
jgi:hypothetical protein